MTASGAGRGSVLPAVLLVLLTVTVFSFGFANGFVNWDDPGAIVENAAIRDFSLAGMARLFTETTFFAYVPLTFVSYAVDYRLFGREPFGFHLTSLLLHVLAALLLYRVALRWTRFSPWLAAAAAAVFAVHPAQVEGVTWMAGRKDPLAAVFLFAGCLCFARALESVGRRRRVSFILALGLAVLANLAKASAIVFPLLFLAHDLFVTPREERSARTLAKRHAGFFAAAAGLAVLHLAIASGTGVASAGGDALSRLARAGQVFLAYVAKTAFPVGLSPHYEFTVRAAIGLLGLAVFGALAIASAVALFRGGSASEPREPQECGRTVALGTALFLAALLPVNTIFPATSVLAADRYLYLPLAGAGLVFAAGLRAAFASARGGAVLAGIAAVAAMSVLTVRQESYWRDSETLWARAAEIEPESALVELKRAEVHVERSLVARSADARSAELGRAEVRFRRALALTRVPAHELQAMEGLAITLLQEGKSAEAEAAYDSLFSRLDAGLGAGKPEAELSRFRANAHLNRGQTHLVLGRDRAALLDFDEAVRLEPGSADALYNRGTIKAKLGLEGRVDEGGDVDAAVLDLAAAAALRPTFTDAWIQLGTIEKARRNLVEAVKAFESAAKSNPARADGDLALARLWIAEGMVDEADKAAARAAAAAPSDPRPHLLRGQIRLSKGALDEAEVQFNKAAAVAPDLREARAGLANVHLERCTKAAKGGDFPAAERHAAAAKAVVPDDAAPRLRLAGLLAQRLERDLAKIEYDEALARFPGDADVATSAALFFKDLGYWHLLRKEEAPMLESFARAAELRPEDPAYDAVRSILASRKSPSNSAK